MDFQSSDEFTGKRRNVLCYVEHVKIRFVIGTYHEIFFYFFFNLRRRPHASGYFLREILFSVFEKLRVHT